ncbi:UNKNOWN [Stylonychia lemnae]|uniref:Uncharacterized protein n=1 Tax=Stylonychia lemnae TaxID=5949 RepID=A0A077ZV18_STYLE|nr:UNKNOWN [Stylonychia lemnae]|eukprot:CDW73444.1 UNKNOWN [Stylonychia lemnae]
MKHEWDYVSGGKTSVKIHNAPGWDYSQDKVQNNLQGNKNNSNNQNYQSSYQRMNNNENQYGGAQQNNTYNNYAAGAPRGQENPLMMQQMNQQQAAVPRMQDDRSSVKIHNPPGGRSNFQIGGYGGNEDLSFKQPAVQNIQPNNQYQSFQQEFGQILPQYQPKTEIFGNNIYNAPQQMASNSGNMYSGNPKPINQNQNDYRQGISSGQYQRSSDLIGGGGSGGSTPNFDPYNPSRQSYQQKPIQQQIPPNQMPLFGQRVISGNNCGPTTEKSSVKLHAPPGGKTSIQLF